MRGMKTVVIAVLFSLIGVMFPVSSSAAVPDFWSHLTSIHDASLDGPAYAAVKFTVAEDPDPGESDLAFWLDIAESEEWTFLAAHFLDENGNPGGAIRFGGGCGGPPEIHVDAGDIFVHEVLTEGGCGGGGMGVGLGGFEPGTYTIVSLVGADGAFAAGYSVLAADHLTVGGLTSGDGFQAADEDFAGTANVHARAVAAEAQAIADGSVSETVENSLFAWFTSDGRASLTRVDGPDGSQMGRNFHILQGAPAGDYTFAVEAKADASAIFWTRVWLLGADVTLP